MGLVLLQVCALVAGFAVICLAFWWLEPEDAGRLSEGARRRIRREQ